MKKVYAHISLFIILIAIGLISCERENIGRVAIDDDIQISAMKVVYRNFYAVNIVVTAVFSNGCGGHKETVYPKRNDIDGHPLWRDGDVIEIQMTGYLSSPGDVCTDAVEFYHESIFIGYCRPGEYTLNVNGYTKTFRVGIIKTNNS